MGVRIVKRDVGGERVNELVLIHARIVRGFRVWIRHFSLLFHRPDQTRGRWKWREKWYRISSALRQRVTVPGLWY